MNEEEPPTQTEEEQYEEGSLTQLPEGTGGSRMQARKWAIAYQYAAPADYGIPELPSWTACRSESNGLSFARDDETDPFISAEHPVRVRR